MKNNVRKLNIENKIIKYKLYFGSSPFSFNNEINNSYISIWDGKNHKIKLIDFMKFCGFNNNEEDYVSHNGNDFIPQFTPGNVKKYYQEIIKKNKIL
jgi:hypothetical protein